MSKDMGGERTAQKLLTLHKPKSSGALRKGVQGGSLYGSDELIGLSQGYTRKGQPPQVCKVTAKCACCWSAWMLPFLLLLGLCTLIALMLYPKDEESVFLAFQGDTLLLDKADILLYKQWRIKEVQYPGDYPNYVKLFNVPCAKLVTRQYEGHHTSQVHHLTWPTRSLAHLDFLYLLKESTIVYNICLWANKTTPPVELFAFDSETDYQEFVAEQSTGESSVAHYVLEVGSWGSPVCTQVQFAASKSSYYFLTASCSGDVAYQYNITSYVNYLNWTDYTDYPSCAIQDSIDSCSLTLDGRIFPPHKDHCLIAHVAKIPPYLVAPPTTHMKVDTKRRYTVVIVPACLLVIVILWLLVYITIVWKYYRRPQVPQGYQRI